uniref:AlNc14C209G8872 protein n=1 Tax=Albugo laibachii Nc14 TaxID=890382 RepID=F0WR64_9STRA|nr:AlNc14C209G8872 [Albugo laibachii Nc14]|eukprot:CCA23825.1 AlNc14C209G8872 [Albugo laibachii Nc14]
MTPRDRLGNRSLVNFIDHRSIYCRAFRRCHEVQPSSACFQATIKCRNHALSKDKGGEYKILDVLCKTSNILRGAAIVTDVSAGEPMTRFVCHRSSVPALSRFASGKGASPSCICMLYAFQFQVFTRPSADCDIQKEPHRLSQQTPKTLQEPVIVRSKGRPRRHIGSTRRDLSGFDYVEVTQKTNEISCRACGEQGHRSDSKKCKKRKPSAEIQSDVWV